MVGTTRGAGYRPVTRPGQYWEDPRLGFDPETQDLLQQWGVYPRHDGSLLEPLRMVNQTLLDPIAIAGDVLMNAPTAAVKGAGTVAGETAYALGASQSDAARWDREAQNLLTAGGYVADGGLPGAFATPGKTAHLLDAAANDYAPAFTAMLADQSGAVPIRAARTPKPVTAPQLGDVLGTNAPEAVNPGIAAVRAEMAARDARNVGLPDGPGVHDFTDADWLQFQQLHPDVNLTPSTTFMPVQLRDGRTIQIPGGTDGVWSYPDLLKVKAAGINPNDLPGNMHLDLHRKLLRSVQPQGELAPHEIFNQFTFGMMSPNNPLFPNEIGNARVFASSMDDVHRMASTIPWQVGEDLAPYAEAAGFHGDTAVRDYRNFMSNQIARAYGLNGASTPKALKPPKPPKKNATPDEIRAYNRDVRAWQEQAAASDWQPGLGATGSTDYTRLAEFAQMYGRDPDWFRFKNGAEAVGRNDPAEHWANYVERISSQIQGLSAKTGSFAGVWQDPSHAAISAIDRHMVRQYLPDIFADPEARAAWETRVVDAWNADGGRQPIAGLDDLRGRSGGEGFLTDYIFGELNKHKSPKTRTAGKGEMKGQTVDNPALPDHLKSGNFLVSPGHVNIISDQYRRALDAGAADAAHNNLGLFGNQWFIWDKLRNRFEPHEIRYPGLEKLPRMSMEQLKRSTAAHRATGHVDYTKVESTRLGRGGAEVTDPNMTEERLKPTRPYTGNPSNLAYWTLPPTVLGSMGLLGGNYEGDTQ